MNWLGSRFASVGTPAQYRIRVLRQTVSAFTGGPGFSATSHPMATPTRFSSVRAPSLRTFPGEWPLIKIVPGQRLCALRTRQMADSNCAAALDLSAVYTLALALKGGRVMCFRRRSRCQLLSWHFRRLG